MTDTIEKVQEDKLNAENEQLDEITKGFQDSRHFDAIRLLYSRKDDLGEGFAKIIKAQEEKGGKDFPLLRQALGLSCEYVFTRIIQILKDDKNV